MFCTNCGTELKDGTKFCPKCGIQVENEIESAGSVIVEKAEKEWKKEKLEENQGEAVSQEEVIVENMVENNNESEIPQIVTQSVEVKKSLEETKQIQEKKLDLNSGLVNFAIVAGVVLLLVGTAFFISRPKDENSNVAGGFGNGDSMVVGDNEIGDGADGAQSNNVENSTSGSGENSTDNSESTNNVQMNQESEVKEETVLKREETYENGELYKISEYDKNGNKVYWWYYYDHNSTWDEDYYTYDENNNLLSEKYDSLNGYVTEDIYEYDDKNRVTLEQHNTYYSEDGDTSSYYYRITYLEEENIVYSKAIYYEFDYESGIYTPSGAYWEEKIVYDGNGNVLEVDRTKYNSQQEITSTKNETYKYDTNGGIIEEKKISYDGSLGNSEEYHSYEYDILGNIISSYYSYCSEGIIEMEYNEIYEYDSNLNSCIKRTRTGIDNFVYGGAYTWIQTYEYFLNQ